MRKKKSAAFVILCLCTLIVMTSCTTNGGVRTKSVPQQQVANTAKNARLSENGDSDPDPDLYFGDLGVEQILFNGKQARIRSLAAGQPLLDPNGFPLIRQYPNPSIAPVKGSYVENVIQTGKSFLGTPYVYGSDRTEPSSFDCSDFTRWVFLTALGMDLPWDSRSQGAYVKAFSKRQYTSLKEARRGDLLFFTNYRGNKASDYEGLAPSEKPISHLGIYLGGGKILHCPSKKSGGVNIHNLTWRQLTSRFLFGGAII